jgi:hypothetical protein
MSQPGRESFCLDGSIFWCAKENGALGFTDE